jgi:hypothetical protein
MELHNQTKLDNNFTSSSYEPCSYTEALARTTGPGQYMLNTPSNDQAEWQQDILLDPSMNIQKHGANFCPSGSAIDDESELYGLSYKNSKCNLDQYAPGKYSAQGICQYKGEMPVRHSEYRPIESTRLSSCVNSVKDMTHNRWFFLCEGNPQNRAIERFSSMVNTDIMFKDNHIPCIDKPDEQDKFMPPATDFSPAYVPKIYYPKPEHRYPYSGNEWSNKSCNQIS